MNNDRMSRLITLGEAKVDPQKHLLLNPLHHYDEDVEFVSEIKPLQEQPETYDDSLLKSKISAIEEEIYSYYSFKTESEKKNFLQDFPNGIIPFMNSIIEMNSPLTAEEDSIYKKIRDLKVDLQRAYKEHKNSSMRDELFRQAKTLT